jgi:hypothetical protein
VFEMISAVLQICHDSIATTAEPSARGRKITRSGDRYIECYSLPLVHTLEYNFNYSLSSKNSLSRR